MNAMCATAVRLAPDDRIRAPLWTWPPHLAKAVLAQRRRRFGIEDERILPTELEEDEDVTA